LLTYDIAEILGAFFSLLAMRRILIIVAKYLSHYWLWPVVAQIFDRFIIKELT